MGVPFCTLPQECGRACGVSKTSISTNELNFENNNDCDKHSKRTRASYRSEKNENQPEDKFENGEKFNLTPNIENLGGTPNPNITNENVPKVKSRNNTRNTKPNESDKSLKSIKSSMKSLRKSIYNNDEAKIFGEGKRKGIDEDNRANNKIKKKMCKCDRDDEKFEDDEPEENVPDMDIEMITPKVTPDGKIAKKINKKKRNPNLDSIDIDMEMDTNIDNDKRHSKYVTELSDEEDEGQNDIKLTTKNNNNNRDFREDEYVKICNNDVDIDIKLNNNKESKDKTNKNSKHNSNHNSKKNLNNSNHSNNNSNNLNKSLDSFSNGQEHNNELLDSIEIIRKGKRDQELIFRKKLQHIGTYVDDEEIDKLLGVIVKETESKLDNEKLDKVKIEEKEKENEEKIGYETIDKNILKNTISDEKTTIQNQQTLDKSTLKTTTNTNLNTNDKTTLPKQTIEEDINITKNPIKFKSDKSIYIGQWSKDANRNGYGIHIYPDGSKYEGQWFNDNINGFGRFIHKDGSYYEGNWLNGLANGNGLFVGKDGTLYKGFWDRDMQHGYGKELLPDNCTYEGNYIRGHKIGLGKFTWSDSSYYEGNFGTNSEMNGNGIYHWKDGRVYSGEWLDNKMHGKGIYRWLDGKQYIGEYQHDKKDGYGKYMWNSEKYYEGFWKNGKFHGNGVISEGTSAIVNNIDNLNNSVCNTLIDNKALNKSTTDNELIYASWRFGKKIKVLNEAEKDEFKKKIEECCDKISSSVFRINGNLEATLENKKKEFEKENRF